MPEVWFSVLKLLAIETFVIVTFLILLTLLFLTILRRIQPYHGKGAFRNKKAIVVKEMNPEGYVKVQGEIWRARSDSGETIATDTRVIVLDQDGLELVVEPLSENH